MKPGRPQANLRLETKTVEELVALVARGKVRMPSPLRGLRWTAEDVVALFDSIYRGYPVGSILLRKGPAEAARIQVGPLSIDVPEREDALWVVDGQQRLIALAAGLLRPAPVPTTSEDPWVVYFDAGSRMFSTPPSEGRISSTWVPVTQWLNTTAFHKWIGRWPHVRDSGLRLSVFEARSLILDFRIPLYAVETADEGELREIFYRLNNCGKSLRWEDVRDGLFGQPGRPPSTLREMAENLRKLGMGTPEKGQMISCLRAFQGSDIARAEGLAGAASDLLPAVRRALSFLKLHAEIPHLRLLPRSLPLTVLTRFFEVYREPKARSLTLLVRWTWRLLLSSGSNDQRTLLRQSLAAIHEGDEEKCIQALLSLVPKESGPYVLPLRFEPQAADSRIALLGLASLRPLNLESGAPVDISGLLEQRGSACFRRIFPGDEELGQGPENRMLAGGSGTARKELVKLAGLDGWEALLVSHAISPEAADALREGDAEAFLTARKVAVEDAVNLVGERLAAWSGNDRPSIRYLLDQVEFEGKPDEAGDQAPADAPADRRLRRFSLASAQLKFSALREGDEITLLVQGPRGGNGE